MQIQFSLHGKSRKIVWEIIIANFFEMVPNADECKEEIYVTN